jgi:16S rRNA (guanine966-N2)-methyltransferase
VTRIIAGSAKGQHLDVPAVGTRPTSDRMREALFSSLNSWLLSNSKSWTDVSLVDLFAGSGAIALEAASRGCRNVTAVESNLQSTKVITGNIQRLGLLVAAVRTDVFTWTPTAPVDIVFLDPPYDMADQQVVALVGKLSSTSQMEDTLFVVERGVRSSSPWGEMDATSIVESWDRTYGDSRLWYGHLVGGLK